MKKKKKVTIRFFYQWCIKLKDIQNKHKEIIVELLEEILEFYHEEDWLIVKKYILRYSHPDVRKYFSTRNQKSKKHCLNEFEKYLVSYCKDNYNKNLVLKEEDTHNEKD
jgi:hypothetical protein